MGWILDMDARRPLSCCARDETRLEKYISPSKKLARALLTIIRLVWKKNLKSTHLKTHKDVECFASKSSGMIATPTFLAVTGAGRQRHAAAGIVEIAAAQEARRMPQSCMRKGRALLPSGGD
jgi:hypothetical protein